MEPFAEIYSKYQQDIYRFLLRLSGGDPLTAEELTQETFYQAFLSFGKFRGDCAMKTWLCGIAKHVFGKYVRHEQRQRGLAEKLTPDQAAPPVTEETETREQLRHIRLAMERLPEPMRTVAEYRLCSGLSYAEIARLVPVREAAAAVMCSRAKQRLRQILREEFDYEI